MLGCANVIWRCDLVPGYLALKADIDAAIARVLSSGRYVLAEEVAAFEEEFARTLGTRFVVGVADGTRAISLALRALGIGSGDEVVTTAFTAFPTIGAILDVGARPVLVDVDPDTYLIDREAILRAVTSRTRAVVPVHIFGNVFDVEELRSKLPPGIRILEDAAQAHGSSIRGRAAGSIGDVGTYSFYPTKNLGCYGDGGAIATDDEAMARTLRLLRNHGNSDKDAVALAGVNSRLDELQAAILRAKLPHLEAQNAARRRIADAYRSRLPKTFRHQRVDSAVIPNFHVFESRYSGDRDGLVAHLADGDIQSNVYYAIPHHLQPATTNLGYRPGDLPVTEALARDVIALPMYPELPQESLDLVVQEIAAFERGGRAPAARR